MGKGIVNRPRKQPFGVMIHNAKKGIYSKFHKPQLGMVDGIWFTSLTIIIGYDIMINKYIQIFVRIPT